MKGLTDLENKILMHCFNVGYTYDEKYGIRSENINEH